MNAFRPAVLLLTGALLAATITGIAQTGPVQGSAAVRVSTRPKPAAVRPAAFKAAFERDVQPILQDICAGCHDAEHAAAAGGLDAVTYSDPASLVSKRDGWEKVLSRLRAGEMPPPTAQQPSEEELNAFIATVQSELDRIDRVTPPDPGRVTAHRLNRAEYTNTIRDLLGVDFRATDEFPADDSGYGFDNIGDVLTVSPALMQKYLSAAERIAARAIGGDPLPSPGVFTRRDRVRRLSDNVIELEYIFD
jgi:mono/diheme cytochrome c family protein